MRNTNRRVLIIHEIKISFPLNVCWRAQFKSDDIVESLVCLPLHFPVSKKNVALNKLISMLRF